MATILQRYQALHAQTLTKLEEAMASTGANVTVGGLSVDRMGYIRELQAQLTELEKKPGVVPDVTPIFTSVSVAR